MASFLTSALNLQAPSQQTGFTDVDPAGVHAANIEALYAAQITTGCEQDPLQYCPNRPITRAELYRVCRRVFYLSPASWTRFC